MCDAHCAERAGGGFAADDVSGTSLRETGARPENGAKPGILPCAGKRAGRLPARAADSPAPRRVGATQAKRRPNRQLFPIPQTKAAIYPRFPPLLATLTGRSGFYTVSNVVAREGTPSRR
ncbi:hypothetical protein [Burkholderia sp. Ac-20379]|uniref:hypothetical protein n=1 Tax=Burkholderia sp. Ac-20379 TaxID=2703900 RepID=UPI00197F722D|nr:hypothetical protein [Burkholderia sp. Ac-20379]MBN3727858.1 hypothetical protein [Burkholderia sp. Ac-20379]